MSILSTELRSPGGVMIHCAPKKMAVWLMALALAQLASCRAVAADERPARINLSALEQLAYQRNPTLRQAGANIEAAQGRTEQAGLYPNPTIGYSGERIGAG